MDSRQEACMSFRFLVRALGGCFLASLAWATPPLSPREALEAFQLPDDLVIELVASEPDVVDPVAISFDERGRMFVVECRDYPEAPRDGEKARSRVTLLENAGDGRYRQKSVFADAIPYVQGAMAWRGGLLVTASPDVIHLRDTKDAGVADEREVLFTGFFQDNPHFHVGNPRMGLDNWVYLNNGLAGGEVCRANLPDRRVSLNRRDFRFHSRTLDFEPVTGMGQFGNTFDAWGNRFFCSNRNPLMYAVLSNRAVERNPWAMISRTHEDVAPAGNNSRLYPLADGKLSTASHAGTHTSACGIHSIRGQGLGGEYFGQTLVCDPAASVVAAYAVRQHGAGFKGERSKERREFLASSDPWFRPVQVCDGPDGALYVVDMYRKVIDHPEFMGNDAALAKTDLRAGDDRGRIYRIRRAEAPRDVLRGAVATVAATDVPRPKDLNDSFVPPRTTADLIALLDSPHGWRRELGQRLLVERKAVDAAAALTELAQEADEPLTRIHALWTLEGLDKLNVEHIQKALDDRSPLVQEHGVRLAERFIADEPALVAELRKMPRPSRRVRFQSILALGESNTPDATRLIAELAAAEVHDPWFMRAALTSTSRRSVAVLRQMLEEESFAAHPDPYRAEMVRQLASVAGARGDVAEIADLLALSAEAPAQGRWWQIASLTGLANGLLRHEGELGETTLALLLSDPPRELKKLAPRTLALVDQADKIACEEQAALVDRVAAIRLMAHGRFERTERSFKSLLGRRSSPEIQTACLDALRGRLLEQSADLILSCWSTLSPGPRMAACDLLLCKEATTRKLLAAVAQKQGPAALISLDERNRLLEHDDAAIREQAERLFGQAAASDRAAVVERYKGALTMPGDKAAGKQVYRRVCSACHQIGNEGNEVGPDIGDLRGKTRAMMLYDILDPNRAVDPRWVSYEATLEDGRVLAGIMESDSPAGLVLRRPGGVKDVLSHAEIEELESSGKSLMPEGFEQEITVEQMADLLEFLKSAR